MPGPAGGPVEEEELPAFERAVDDGLGEAGVAEGIAPLGDGRLVGGEGDRSSFEVAVVDDVEEDVDGVVAVVIDSCQELLQPGREDPVHLEDRGIPTKESVPGVVALFPRNR